MATGLREWAGVNGTLRAEAAATRRHCQHLRTATGAFQAQEALSLKQLCVQRCTSTPALACSEFELPKKVEVKSR